MAASNSILRKFKASVGLNNHGVTLLFMGRYSSARETFKDALLLTQQLVAQPSRGPEDLPPIKESSSDHMRLQQAYLKTLCTATDCCPSNPLIAEVRIHTHKIQGKPTLDDFLTTSDVPMANGDTSKEEHGKPIFYGIRLETADCEPQESALEVVSAVILFNMAVAILLVSKALDIDEYNRNGEVHMRLAARALRLMSTAQSLLELSIGSSRDVLAYSGLLQTEDIVLSTLLLRKLVPGNLENKERRVYLTARQICVRRAVGSLLQHLLNLRGSGDSTVAEAA